MAQCRVAVIIPARWGSVRFPGKPLSLLFGEPIIAHVIRRAFGASQSHPGVISDIVVATDDQRIASVAKMEGATVAMTPSDCQTGTDRVLLAAKNLELKSDDWVINVQGDEPLVNPQHIQKLAWDSMASKGVNGALMRTMAVRDRSTDSLFNQNVVKVVVDDSHHALYFSRAPIPFYRDLEQETTNAGFLRHLGIYSYRFDFLDKFSSTPASSLEKIEKLEQLRALQNGYKIHVTTVDGPCFFGVDTPDQLAQLNQFSCDRQ